MRASISLGRIAGVRVGANWSVLAIVALIAVGLASGALPQQYPGRSTAAYAVSAVVAAFVFLASLLAHEVSHAVVAKRNGLEVDGITLWLLGGVALLKGEPTSPGADLRIAGVGPLVSLLLGGVFAGAAAAAGLAGIGGLPLGVLFYLAGINVVLAIFNLIPAAPLDGGRLLRAAVWRFTGDRTRAAVVAARAGRVFGIALIAFGLLQVFTGLGYGGLWLAFIGFFVINAAQAEQQQAVVADRLSGIRVADVMSPYPMTVPADVTVESLLRDYALVHRFSAYPLVEGDRPVGLVTLNRLRGVPVEERATTAVRAVACPLEEVPAARRDEALTTLLPRLSGCTDGRALVVEDGHLVGIVSPSDISRALHTADLRREVLMPRA